MCEFVLGRMSVCARPVVGTVPTLRAIHCDRMMSVFYTLSDQLLCVNCESSWTGVCR